MRLKILGGLLLLFFPLLSLAQTGLWLAKKGDQTIILAGVPYFSSNDGAAWPNAYFDAFQKAQKVVFERAFMPTDLLVAADLVDQTFNQLRLPAGQTLQSQLSEDNWAQLQQLASDHLPEVLPYKAPIAGIVLLDYDRYQRGFLVNTEQEFYQLAQRQNKQIDVLETPSQYFKHIVDRQKSDPNAVIELLLYQLNEPTHALNDRITATYQANIGFFNFWEKSLSHKAKVLYDQMIMSKNNLWIVKIDQLLNDHTPTLVILPMENLVTEKIGLLNSLKNKGYQITPYPDINR